MLSSSFSLFPQQHCNPRWQAQQDTSDLGEGNPRPWEQWHGSCQVPFQPSCQGHWTQNPGGKWIYFSNKIFISRFWGVFESHIVRGKSLNYSFVLLLLCIQYGSLISTPFGAIGDLLLAACLVKGFVCLLRLSGKGL